MADDFPCGATLLLEGPAGALEALTGCPAPGQAADATAIVCHPHPQHGGTLHNKVVHTLARACAAAGARTVRFNFRGVGRSAGAYDHGVGETDDLLAVVAWVRARRPRDALWLAGFSFGAYVVARAAQPAAAARVVLVAPAVNLRDFDALGPPAFPWLVIQGEADEVVPPAAVRAWAARLDPAPELVPVPGVGHYFHGRLPELREIITGRLRQS
jgi:hypothetical protein